MCLYTIYTIAILTKQPSCKKKSKLKSCLFCMGCLKRDSIKTNSPYSALKTYLFQRRCLEHEFVLNSVFKMNEIMFQMPRKIFLDPFKFSYLIIYFFHFKLLESLTRAFFYVRVADFFLKNLQTIQMCFIQGSFRVWVRAMQPNITCKLVSIIGLILKHVHCYRPWTTEWFSLSLYFKLHYVSS